MRKLVLPAAAALLPAPVAGCGNGGTPAGGGAAAAATPAQIEDAGSLALVRAHQIASMRLYEKGRVGQAAKHAGHPTEEIFVSLARKLRSRDATLTAELRNALKKTNDLILENAPPGVVRVAYDEAREPLDRAETLLVPQAVRGTAAFRAQTIANLLEKVEQEYGEAIEADRIGKEIQYQNAWGALEMATQRFSGGRSAFGEEAARIDGYLAALHRALPGVETPHHPAPKETVGEAVDGAVAALAEVAGAEVASDPLSEVRKTAELLAVVRSKYAAGKRQEAEELATEAYLEHFEKAEPELGKRDRELMEKLEMLLATKLRSETKAGAPEATVDALIERALGALDRAEAVLKDGG